MFNELTKEQRIFVDDIILALNNKNEITMTYKDIQFVVDPHGKFIQIYSHESVIAYYADANDFLLRFEIEGKPIITLATEIDYII